MSVPLWQPYATSWHKCLGYGNRRTRALSTISRRRQTTFLAPRGLRIEAVPWIRLVAAEQHPPGRGASFPCNCASGCSRLAGASRRRPGRLPAAGRPPTAESQGMSMIYRAVCNHPFAIAPHSIQHGVRVAIAPRGGHHLPPLEQHNVMYTTVSLTDTQRWQNGAHSPEVVKSYGGPPPRKT